MRRVLAFIFWATCLSAQTQPAFYRDYSTRKEVANALYMKNHRLDGIKVDVTLIRAKDSAAFRALLADLGLDGREAAPPAGVMLSIRDDKDPRVKPRTKGGGVPLKGSCLMGASEAELTIYVFHNVKNKARLRTIVRHIVRVHRQP